MKNWLFEYGLARNFDVERLKRANRSLRRRLYRHQHGVDRAQDERIEALERECVDLEVCVSTLLSLLASKGILTEEEWLAIAELAQGASERASVELISEIEDSEIEDEGE